ncbi:hypothetical protein DYI95_007325 [Thermaerobacter sp. PB12/4term]|uniref:hypothetical protein n=1 Tax=Thermaerobacter sp. PB12/4term TaxID=2293838 RepID=UPI000E325EDB|nr:hypothetical protein [Thermaerobacter sp. PB12/4term]QIA27368.1 hypothetical protein DYI95_007325 [Thermaerobacter sp. PB12/4term]
MVKKMVATVMIGAVLVGMAGCTWGRFESSVSEQPSEQVAGGSHSEESEAVDAKPLELPMYDVIDQEEMKVPTAKLGEELQVGPVTVIARLQWATNFPIDEDKLALFQIRVRVENL